VDEKVNDRRGPGEIDLLDLLVVLVKRKGLIARGTVGAGILALVVSLLLPPVYRAETKILPPQQTGQGGIATQLISQLGGAAALLGGAMQVKTPAELYIEILKTRTVLDRIADRFHMDNVYKKKYREDTRKRLLKSLKAQEEKKSGIISIAVEDRDRKRAAEMANAFVEELKAVTSTLAVTEAAQRRLFFEEQLKETKVALTRSEESIRGFQERTGALHIDSQARAAIEGIARLRAQISATEVQLKVLRTYTTAQNPDLQKLEEVLRGQRAEMQKLEATDVKGHDPLMPTTRMPSVGTEYFRRLRDVKYNEMLFELLSKQYEIAKLDEARDAAVIQVIDGAVVPEKKAKPRVGIFVLVSTLLAFIVSVFLAIVVEFLERSGDNPDSRVKIAMLRRNLSLSEK
jgi:uncharacterized protein involved in exopolysaccharide biosynthesis